jgi:hypothetical protein
MVMGMENWIFLTNGSHTEASMANTSITETVAHSAEHLPLELEFAASPVK